jgi:hypothetical protein
MERFLDGFLWIQGDVFFFEYLIQLAGTKGIGAGVAFILSIHYRYPYMTPSGAKFFIC